MPGFQPAARMAKALFFAASTYRYRAVAGELQARPRARLALHRDGLVDHRHRLPMALVVVVVAVGRVQVVDVEVLLIDVEDGQAEGDLAVVADGDAGQRRLAGADESRPGAFRWAM